SCAALEGRTPRGILFPGRELLLFVFRSCPSRSHVLTHSLRVVRDLLRSTLAAPILSLLALTTAFAQPHRASPHCDVLPTGNEWISQPDIHADDGELGTFNVISMRRRGLLEVEGDHGSPVLEAYLEIAGNQRPCTAFGISSISPARAPNPYSSSAWAWRSSAPHTTLAP